MMVVLFKLYCFCMDNNVFIKWWLGLFFWFCSWCFCMMVLVKLFFFVLCLVNFFFCSGNIYFKYGMCFDIFSDVFSFIFCDIIFLNFIFWLLMFFLLFINFFLNIMWVMLLNVIVDMYFFRFRGLEFV